MQVSNPNNIKIYNLSGGKSLPEVSEDLMTLREFTSAAQSLYARLV